MTVLVAVTDAKEGLLALAAAAEEAEHFGTDLVVVDLTPDGVDTSSLPAEVTYEVVVPTGGSGVDEVERVLDEVQGRPEVTRLVVGVRRRSPIGKAVLGSIAQRLLLESPVPVLAVKSTDA